MDFLRAGLRSLEPLSMESQSAQAEREEEDERGVLDVCRVAESASSQRPLGCSDVFDDAANSKVTTVHYSRNLLL